MVMRSIPSNEEDYDRIKKAMFMNSPTAMSFVGFKDVIVNNTLKILEDKSSKSIETIIAVPLKSGAALSQLSHTLQELKLDTPTGVVFGLDKSSYVDKDWLWQLNDMQRRLEQKYPLVHHVFTTATPVKELIKGKSDLSLLLDIVANVLTECGVKNWYNVWPIRVVREELRLIFKRLHVKSIFWLDADVIIPQDTIPRLRRLLDRADIACGWYKDRHQLDGVTSVVGGPFWHETLADRRLTEEVNALTARVVGLLKSRLDDSPLGAKINELFQTRMWSFVPTDLPPPCPSWRLEDMKEPFPIGYSGFGCVLCSKDANNLASFLTHFGFGEDVLSEDFAFCREARRAGFRILLDPTIKCEHTESHERSAY